MNKEHKIEMSFNEHALNIMENSTVIKQKIPYATILHSFTLVLIFVVQCIEFNFNPFEEENFDLKDINELDLALKYPDDVVDSDKYWQYYTYSWIHRNILHVFFNVSLFAYLGTFLERKYRWYSLVLLTVLGAIASSFLYVMVREYEGKHNTIFLLGFSGSVYSLVGASISEFVLNPETVRYWWVKMIVSVTLIIAHILEHLFMLQDSGIAVWGHFGGLLFGLIPAMLIIPNYKFKSYEIVFYVLGGIGMVFFFLVLPIMIYSH